MRGGVRKFFFGGGDGVCHSRPRACHGLSPARSPLIRDQAEIGERHEIGDGENHRAAARET